VILASIWFATKTCQSLIFGLPINGNFYAQLLVVKSSAWQILVANQADPKIHKLMEAAKQQPRVLATPDTRLHLQYLFTIFMMSYYYIYNDFFTVVF
jgi:hypothetical protein